ncbi:MAG: phosphatidate cytidylyltransferase [Acidimicrobiales bacterium]|nr:phosphatidate cytidylyltransferase [Acidimicrobiales bacterium]
MDDQSRYKPPDEEGTPEGVRIIGAEEAAEAVERGDLASRRPADAPRFGDRPPAPAGPRPPLRFPLPESADPASLGRPQPAGAAPNLPHWTEPATGEVPRILAEGSDEGGAEGGDDLDAWSSFAQAPRWRDQPSDWEEPDYEDGSLLADETTRLGALDPDRPGEAELFSFDDVEPDTVVTPIRSRAVAAPAEAGHAPATGDMGRNLPLAVGTAVGLAAVALVLFYIGPGAAMILVTPILVLAAAELFGALRKAEYQPATLLGLVAVGALGLASFWRGESAYPLVLFLTVVFGLLWYLVADTMDLPIPNLAITLLGVLYVGVLGSFAALLLKFPNGIGMLLGAVIGAVAYDVGGFFVGRSAGRSQLAPDVSPGKTYEGLIGGMVLAVLACVVIVGRITPWNSFGDALLLGVVVAVAAPLGDLCESMLKRNLGIKDMGGILPGHGGLLDRFDTLLFVLPATYYLVRVLDLF